jgi:AcrR family transcriptional regulator
MAEEPVDIAEDTWSRVLEAAVRQFGTLPYTKVSVAAIAREAGTSQPNVYTYVASKAELYAAALATVVERIMGRVSRAAHEAEPPEVINAVYIALFAQIRRSDLVSLAFQDTDPTRFIELITEPLFQQVRLLLESHLREGQRVGALRADMDPAATAAGATSLTIGAVVAWAHAGRPEGDPRGRTVFDVFRQSIAVATAADHRP